MQLILTSIAIVVAGLGLVLATLRIQSTNKAIAGVWPDWEGLKSPVPFWLLLGVAAILSLAAGVLTVQEQGAKNSTVSTPSEIQASSRIEELETQIAQLNDRLAATNRSEKLAEATKAANVSTLENAPKDSEFASGDLLESAQNPDDVPASVQAPRLTVDPRIDSLSRGVIKSLISGSVKPLEPIAHQTLLDQFTINPFNFSKLQFGLKDRLEEGYAPIYIDSLRTAVGTNHIWKIQTKKPGPDILEQITTADGKVLGFRFDGLY